MFLKFHKTLFLPELAGSQIYFPAPVYKLFWPFAESKAQQLSKPEQACFI